MLSEFNISAEKILDCFGVKSNESVLIVVDTLTPLLISKSIFECSKKRGCETFIITMLPRKHHGEELPSVISEAMKNVDVVIAPTTFSLTHTQAKINACKKGVRVASMPGITENMMSRGGMMADYNYIHNFALKLDEKLKNAKKIRVVTELGTDITFDVSGCQWKKDTGICYDKGCSCNLPAGEIYVAPKNANGVFIVDGSIGGLGLLDSQLEFIVKDRYVIDIKGKHSEKLKKIIEPAGKNGKNIAEFGIGINPEAKLIGVVLEDEKVKGTVHIALGDNSGFGGSIIAGIHIDGVIKKPKIFVDEEVLIL